MKVVKEAIEKALKEKEIQAEKQARLEIRVAFAKELLIPKMAAFVKRKIEELHPLQCSYHKPLSYDLVTVCGEAYAHEVNLGGLLVRPSLSNRDIVFSIFGSYDPLNSMLKTTIALNPVTKMDVDIFKSTSMLTGKPIPEISIDSAALNNSSVYLTEAGCGKQLHVDQTEVLWPYIDGDAYSRYLNDIWDYTADVLFAVSGPSKKEGVL